MVEAKVVKDPDIHEKVLVVVTRDKRVNSSWTLDEVSEEMVELVNACGGEVVDTLQFLMHKISAGNLIGEGRIKQIVDRLAFEDVDTVIFSHDLKGNQQRNLEDALNVKTIDRTQLILDIFAKHASTKEGKIQVELAQLEYLLPRLVGRGIELSRLGGGIGTLGPGETKLEIDRRRITQRITKLKKDLKAIVANRSLKRNNRKKKGVPLVSLVGYTNAGKSTLLNTLTEAKQVTRDGLFTTLDSLTRQFILPNHQKVVLSDTVGFMNELPHHLIESFKATLEEVVEADLLLHVVDISSDNYRELYESVIGVLTELNAADKPTVVVFNKIDKLKSQEWIKDLLANFDHAVSISALKKKNLKDLTSLIIRLLSNMYEEINVDVPINRMDLVNLAHEEGEVFSVKYYSKTINIRANVPKHLVGRFA